MSEGNSDLDQLNRLDPVNGTGTPNMWGMFTGSQEDINRVNSERQKVLDNAASSYKPPSDTKYADLWSNDPTTRAAANKYFGVSSGGKSITKYNPNTGQYDQEYDYGNTDYSKVPRIGQALGMPTNVSDNYNVVGKKGQTKQEVAKQFKYLRDPNAIYYDPNYGWIMDHRNEITKDNSVLDKIGQYAPLALSFIPGVTPFALALASLPGAAAKANMSGNWKGFGLSAGLTALGMALPGLGEAGSMVGDALKYGKMGYGLYNAIQGMSPKSSTLQYPGVAQQPSIQTQLSGFNKQNLAAQMLYKQLAQPRKVTYTGR